MGFLALRGHFHPYHNAWRPTCFLQNTCVLCNAFRIKYIVPSFCQLMMTHETILHLKSSTFCTYFCVLLNTGSKDVFIIFLRHLMTDWFIHFFTATFHYLTFSITLPVVTLLKFFTTESFPHQCLFRIFFSFTRKTFFRLHFFFPGAFDCQTKCIFLHLNTNPLEKYLFWI